MNEKKAAYDKEYQKKNVKQINVPFNMQTPEDVELLEWLDEQPNKTRYIKELIDADRRGQDPAKI